MKKVYKVKHYGSFYKKQGTPWPIKLLWSGVFLVLIFVGASLYVPVRDLLSGKLRATLPTPTPIVDVTPTPAPTGTPTPPPQAAIASLRAVQLPPAALLGGELAAAVAATGQADCNAILIDLKVADGTILYKSALPQTQSGEILSPEAIDLAAFCAAASEAGYRVVGRMQMFCDQKGARQIPGAGIRYRDTNMYWLDNAPDAGGKPWMNPYADPAKDYLLALIDEVTRLGVQDLILSSVQFPTGYSLGDMSFEGLDENSTRDAALSAFYTAAAARASANGGRVMAYTFADTTLGVGLERYGGALPQTLFPGPLAVGLMPSGFGEVFAAGGLTLESPYKTPYETVKATLGTVLPTLPAAGEAVAVLQGYADQKTATPYTATEIQAQIKAVTEAGIGNYIVLYS